ncbi:MAG: hypothetical protein KDA75_19635, partial [Planctomycetaceae bacterium]|nr:hypothetical protein [Planctomycetaceae bacterium]
PRAFTAALRLADFLAISPVRNFSSGDTPILQAAVFAPAVNDLDPYPQVMSGLDVPLIWGGLRPDVRRTIPD